MTAWFSRAFLLFCLAAAGLFQSTLFSDSGAPLAVVALLAVSSLLIAEVVRFTALRSSPNFVLNLLLSVVVGFGSATILVLCMGVLGENHLLLYPLAPFVRFLLPVTMTLMAFWGLQAFSFFQLRGRFGMRGAASSHKIIPDVLALEDGRIIDLARTGLLNGQLLLPSFLSKELTKLSSGEDEDLEKIKAKKALDSLHRLEALPNTNVVTIEFAADESSIAGVEEAIIRFSEVSDSLILTCDHTLIQSEASADLYISIESIANALRSPIPKGELLPIKIQRLGKEPKQGIGYLDDGTMVVVNGGGDFLGRTVRTQVLSQKYSSSGKIVFCNVRDECEELPMATPYTHPEAVRTHESMTSV